MPSHTHAEQFPFTEGMRPLASTLNSSNTQGNLKSLTSNLAHVSNDTLSNCITVATGGSAHNNMPPYLAVNIWQRTA